MSSADVMRLLGLPAAQHARLFDDDGFPREVDASSSAALLSTIIPPELLAWLAHLPRKPLTDVLRSDYQGRPMVIPSLSELVAVLPANASTVGGGGSARGRGGDAPPAPPAPASGAAPMDRTLALALKQEDELFDIMFDEAAREESMKQAVVSMLGWALERLRGTVWPTCTWPVKGGTPFEVKLTKATAASFGVNAEWYFALVPSPMDLTRMGERCGKGTYTERKGGARAVDVFFADAEAIARCAKVYNGPKELQDRGTPDAAFPHPSTLPPSFSVGAGSIYGMAFEFQEAARALRDTLHAALPVVQRLVLRGVAKNAPATQQSFYTPIKQAVLASATRALAEQARTPGDLLDRAARVAL